MFSRWHCLYGCSAELGGVFPVSGPVFRIVDLLENHAASKTKRHFIIKSEHNTKSSWDPIPHPTQSSSCCFQLATPHDSSETWCWQRGSDDDADKRKWLTNANTSTVAPSGAGSSKIRNTQGMCEVAKHDCQATPQQNEECWNFWVHLSFCLPIHVNVYLSLVPNGINRQMCIINMRTWR